jgi:hypothetical protein
MFATPELCRLQATRVKLFCRNNRNSALMIGQMIRAFGADDAAIF